MWFFKSKKTDNKQIPSKVQETDPIKVVKKTIADKNYEDAYNLAINSLQATKEKEAMLVYAFDAGMNYCKKLIEAQRWQEIIELSSNAAIMFKAWYFSEKILSFINEKKGTDHVYQNPEEVDPIFLESAQLVFQHQVASVSLLQRRLNLGYARAGRIIDQLEEAGIVEPFQGSKSRKVLFERQEEFESYLRKYVGGEIYTYSDIQKHRSLFEYGIDAWEKQFQTANNVANLSSLTSILEAYLLLDPFNTKPEYEIFAHKLINANPTYSMAYVVMASRIPHYCTEEERTPIDALYFKAIESEPNSWYTYQIILHNIFSSKMDNWFVRPEYFKLLMKNFGAPEAKFNYWLYDIHFQIFQDYSFKVRLLPKDFLSLQPFIEKFMQNNPNDTRSYVLYAWLNAGLLDHNKTAQLINHVKTMSPSAEIRYPIPTLPKSICDSIVDIITRATNEFSVVKEILINAYIINNFSIESKLDVILELNSVKYTNLPFTDKSQITGKLLEWLRNNNKIIDKWSLNWDLVHDNFAKMGTAIVYDINESEWYMKISDEVKEQMKKDNEKQHIAELQEIEEEIREATSTMERKEKENELRSKQEEVNTATIKELDKSIKVMAFLAGAAAGHGLFKVAEDVVKGFTGDPKDKKVWEYKPGKFWA